MKRIKDHSLKPFKVCTASRERGGAAIEYVIVSAFATLLAVAAVAFVSTSVKSRLAELEEKLGVTFDASSLEMLE